MKFFTATIVALAITAPCFAFTVSTRTTFIDRHGVKLHMVGEIVEGANAALNALPLLAGPAAALAAGQAARSEKKRIESEVEFAERELDDVKRRLKNTDTLINGSFGLAVVSAGFVAVQAFGGESLMSQSNLESIDEAREFLLPSSSQQLAIEDQKPATESIKELMKADTSKSVLEKKLVTSDSEYDALVKKMESAGKNVGETVESNKPASTATAPIVKELAGGKINSDVVLVPAKTAVEKTEGSPAITSNAKVDDSVSKAVPTEKASSVVAVESKNTEGILSTAKEASAKSVTTSTTVAKEESASDMKKEVVDNAAEKTRNEKPAPVVAVESKKVDEPVKILNEKPAPDVTVESKKVDEPVKILNEKPAPVVADESKKVDEPVKILNEKPGVAAESKKVDEPVVPKDDKATAPTKDSANAVTASTEKIAAVSVLKSVTDEKSLAQSMEAAGKAGSDLVEPTTTTSGAPNKESLESSPTYDSLFKKIEAAGKASDEAVKPVDTTSEPLSSSKSTLSEQVSPIKSAVTKLETEPTKGSSTAASTIKTVDTAPGTNTPIVPSFSSTDDSTEDSSNTGVYMKEAVSALGSLGLPKIVSPLSTSSDYKLPSFSAPELSMPQFSMPELSIPDFNVPSIEDIPLAAKVAAGVFAVGGTGLAIALSLNDEETVGSTMPIGAKKKGSSYLEGLSRSSTTLQNNGASANGISSGSTSYLNDLAASVVSPQQGQTTNAPYNFTPDPSRVTAVQESSVSPSFNFAPNAGAESSQYQAATGTSVNGGNNFAAPNGEKQNDSTGSNQLFNFSPKLFDFANKRGSSDANRQDNTDSPVIKPEPPMGGESPSYNSYNEKVDWGNKGVDGGYLWEDPAKAQKAGSGVGSYLDNLATTSVGPNPYTNPIQPKVGSYNSYLEAMNQQQQPPQQYQDSNQPPTVKTFSKTPRTGSYVDSL